MQALFVFCALLGLSVSSSFSAYAVPSQVLVAAEHPILKLGRQLLHNSKLTREDILQIRSVALKDTDKFGRATPSLQTALLEFESLYASKFDSGAAAAFQTLVAAVGARMNGKIQIPENNTPYWLKDPGPLDLFKSTPQLPDEVDYLVVGAGLTGAAAALELSSETATGKNVAVLEAGDRPASGASGRNGGNIEMIKENFIREYRGFVEVQKDTLRERFPQLSENEITFQAERQSEYLLKFFLQNVREIEKTVNDHHIKADVSMTGWLRIADSAEEEQSLADEIAFAKKIGLEFEVWTPQQIQERLGITTKYSGRFIKESGNYHPFKYVNEVLKVAISKGVKLYTQTKVEKIDEQADGTFLVTTNQGTIRAKKILMATNAYTRDIFPEMKFIEPRVTHIANYTHTEDKFEGMTVTSKLGDWYGNFPGQDRYVTEDGEKRGTLHAGGGKDTPFSINKLHKPPFIKGAFYQMMKDTNDFIPDTAGRPPIASWNGVMGFTFDRAPILSFKYTSAEGPPNKNIVFAVAFNGYGGSQCAIAGKTGAQMLKTGVTPASIPDDIFSMRRFLTKEPLFKLSSKMCSRVLLK